MRYIVFALCVILGTAAALPSRPARASALDLLYELENIIEDDGKQLIGKLLNITHHVEDAVLRVKEMVPKIYEKIHQDADEVLAGLKKVTDEIEELLGKKKVQYSLDFFGGLSELSELTGGTKLSTVFTLLSLADKAHRVMNDAKEFVPHLQKELEKMKSKIQAHVDDFMKHVMKEIGQEEVVHGVAKKIESIFENVENEIHRLILNILHNIETTFDDLKEKFPELYDRLEEDAEEIRLDIQRFVAEIEKSIVMRGFSLIDIAGDMTGGTKLSTVFRIVSLIQKFNAVVQDAREFEPKAEVFLRHSMKKVEDSAYDFFARVSEIMNQ